jgi:putative addiction module component (TIGR02574 family)
MSLYVVDASIAIKLYVPEVHSELLASLDSPNQKQIDDAWAEEAERRMREIDDDKVEAIDGELVMQRLRARYKKVEEI